MLGESGSAVQTHFHGKAVEQKVVEQESLSLLQWPGKILYSLQLFLPLLLTEIPGISCGSLERGDSLSSLFMWVTRKVLRFSSTWILCSNNVNALGSNELKWETQHLIDNCLNKPFIKSGVVVRTVTAACQRQWRERLASVFFKWSNIFCCNCCYVLDAHRCEMTLHSKTAQQKPFSLSLGILNQNFWEIWLAQFFDWCLSRECQHS